MRLLENSRDESGFSVAKEIGKLGNPLLSIVNSPTIPSNLEAFKSKWPL